MKKVYLQLLFVFMLAPVAFNTDPIENVASLVRQGNISELAKLFADNVDLSVLGNDNVYSRLQAEQILDQFFNKNKPRTVKTLHKVNSNPNYSFGVLIVNTANGIYRVAFTLKKTSGDFTLIEFRIETDKVK